MPYRDNMNYENSASSKVSMEVYFRKISEKGQQGLQNDELQNDELEKQ